MYKYSLYTCIDTSEWPTYMYSSWSEYTYYGLVYGGGTADGY